MPIPPAIVLASASPRRREMLERFGIPLAVIPSDLPEDFQPGETPTEHVLRLSHEKARQVAQRPEVAGRWFIGSDTIVLRDQTILNKPENATEAMGMLTSLSGRCHQVLSGYAVFDRKTGLSEDGVVTTEVEFRELTARQIAGYIATGEPMDKAGAYAIQGIGAFMVRRIEGSYTSVVGLPLCEVIEALEKLGAIKLFEGAGLLTPESL
jgi:septum formation protein